MKNLFQSVRILKPKGNLFDLSHERKLSCHLGSLVPILVQEIVPGDKFKVNTEMLMRFAPMLAPVMHRINVYIHFFFVPWRLVWNEWETHITGGEDGQQVPTYPKFFVNSSKAADIGKGSLWDHMGLPIYDSGAGVFYISALPFRAYQTIYNEYYRDQNLESKISFGLGGSPDTDWTNLVTMRQRGLEKDYFTSCLPWSQRGGDVELPLNGNIEFEPSYSEKSTVLHYDDAGQPTDQSLSTVAGKLHGATENIDLRVENLENSDYDLVDGGIAINDLRRALKLQEWLEKNARGGARYIEQILSHFGVRSSDARLQRPEYLGGGKSPVVISEVLSTVKESTNPQGTMAGHGISVGNTNSFKRRFEEHGVVMGILSVLPRTAYMNTLDRMFTRFDKLDHFWPEFANLGEQEVKNKEVFGSWNISGGYNPEGLFGYQARYAEYKFKNSSVHGDFRDNLDFWHMARQFASCPSLTNAFIKPDLANMKRIFAVDSTSVDELYIQLYNNVKAFRPMPRYGIPSI